MSYYKTINFIKKLCKNCHLNTSSRPFYVCQESSKTSSENEIFEASYLYYVCNRKTINIWPSQHADLLRFFFTEIL